jgi:protein SCO1/2
MGLITAIGAAIVLAAVVVADHSSGAGAAPHGPGLAGATIDAPAPPLRLRDQDGRRFDLAAERGHVVVVTFLYSTCQDTCPIIAQQIRGALDQLGHDVPVAAISVDPAGDTPFHVRRFLVEQHLIGRMRFLTGTRAQLAPVWRAWGVQPQERDSEHSVHVLLVDPRGRLRSGFPADHLTPEALRHDIAVLEREEPTGGH